RRIASGIDRLLMSVMKTVVLRIPEKALPADSRTLPMFSITCRVCRSRSPSPTSFPSSSMGTQPETNSRLPKRIASAENIGRIAALPSSSSGISGSGSGGLTEDAPSLRQGGVEPQRAKRVPQRRGVDPDQGLPGPTLHLVRDPPAREVGT